MVICLVPCRSSYYALFYAAFRDMSCFMQPLEYVLSPCSQCQYALQFCSRHFSFVSSSYDVNDHVLFQSVVMCLSLIEIKVTTSASRWSHFQTICGVLPTLHRCHADICYPGQENKIPCSYSSGVSFPSPRGFVYLVPGITTVYCYRVKQMRQCSINAETSSISSHFGRMFLSMLKNVPVSADKCSSLCPPMFQSILANVLFSADKCSSLCPPMF